MRYLDQSAPLAAMEATTGATASAAKLNPSMAIIIVVLLATFFFMGFLSIYVKKCVTTEGDLERHPVPIQWAAEQSWIFSSSSAHPPPGHPQSSAGTAAPLGLDQSLIRALPIVTFSNAKECCVCLAEFIAGERLRLLPICGHTFHAPCIDSWLLSHSTCPLCRFKLTPESVALSAPQQPPLPPPPVAAPPADVAPAADLPRPPPADVAPPQPLDPLQLDAASKLPGILLKVWEFFRKRLSLRTISPPAS